MLTDCTASLFEFEAVRGRRVVAGFDGGMMTLDAGAPLLSVTDKAIGLMARVAKCFVDRRNPKLIEHSVATLASQRIFGLAWAGVCLGVHESAGK